MSDGKSGSMVGSLHKALALTWLAYGYFYVLRKALGAVKSALRQDFAYSEHQLASLDSTFLGAYSLGLYISGCLVDAVPPRLVLVAGLLTAASAAALLPVVLPAPEAGPLAWAPAYICWFVHGLAQAAGHPAIQRILGRRLKGSNRSGLYLGLWTTSQTVGGMLGNFSGGLLLQAFGWSAVLQQPGLVAPVVVLLLFVGWDPLEVPTNSAMVLPTEDKDSAEKPRLWRCLGCLRRILGSGSKSSDGDLQGAPQVYVTALAAFFIKFVRYALLFWLPYYNWAALGYDASKAAYHASVFELGGFFGSMGLGPFSDRLTGPSVRKRALPSSLLLVAGAVLLGTCCPQLQASTSLTPAAKELCLAICMFLVGICIDGPESVITGVLCNDLCEECSIAAVGRVVGLVNGTGILGALLAGPAVTLWARSCGGWQSVFPFLAAVALLGAGALVPLCTTSSQTLLRLSRIWPAVAAASTTGLLLLLWSGTCGSTAGESVLLGLS